MKPNCQTVSMKIFISSTDMFRGTPLYEAITLEAKRHGIAGASLTRGLVGYGASGSELSTKMFSELCEKAPIIIEMIDERQKLDVLIAHIKWILNEAKKGYTITITPVEVIAYHAGGEKPS
ncbi:putative ACR [anaerobic digester metagenome]